MNQRPSGYEPEALVRNGTISYDAIILQADRVRVRAEVEEGVRAGKRFEVVYRIVTATGGEKWVSEHGLAVRSPDDSGLFIEGIVTDVTARKIAEEALAKSERTLGAIIDHSVQFIGLLDPSGRLLRANQTVLDAAGVRWEEVAGRMIWETQAWAHSELEKKRLREAVARAAQGEFVRYEATNSLGQGGLLTVDFSLTPVRDAEGRVISIIPEGRDITDRKKAEQALRESEEKYAKAFLSSPHSLTISDLASGRYIEVNAGFERISGYRREEVIGRSSTELGLWHNAADREELVRRLREGGKVRDMEVKFFNRSGEVLVTRCSCEVVELGGKECLLNVIEDITAQRVAEEARGVVEQQMRQTQKLEALGQLAGGIAHDFNNILTGVLAFTELALIDSERPEAVRKHLAEVSRAGRRARDLVRQILAFSRQQIQQRTPVRLSPVIQEAIGLLRSSLPSTIEIEARTDAAVPLVLADATQIHQIVMNLATNAAHAMQAKPGVLSITLESLQLDEAACGTNRGLRPGRYAVLTISDTGNGMDAETLKCVFKPFFTTKGPGEGTGLGLAVVHGIVEDHDGVIQLDSRVGEGTTFRIFFPEHAALVSTEVSEPAATYRGKGEKILFLDDERMIADSARALLEHLGYAVTACTDPRLALDDFLAAPTAFDLVVTDLTMPRITGIEVARQILLVRPEIPILLVSGFSYSWTTDKLRAMGVRGLIAKPLTSAALAAAIRQALDDGSGKLH